MKHLSYDANNIPILRRDNGDFCIRISTYSIEKEQFTCLLVFQYHQDLMTRALLESVITEQLNYTFTGITISVHKFCSVFWNTYMILRDECINDCFIRSQDFLKRRKALMESTYDAVCCVHETLLTSKSSVL